MNIRNLKSIYFVGIKGVAMTALAILAKEMGIKVYGSDVKKKFVTDQVLAKNKIKWQTGFRKENIKRLAKKPDLVVATGAHGGMKNPEAQTACRMGIRTIMHGQALGEFMKDHQGISVAGCHGKTTTAAMIATIFTKSGLDPSFAIGCGNIKSLGNPGHAGKGKYFVAEADEYITCPETEKKPRFLWQTPKAAVFTNIEYDHPDAYPSLEAVKKAFLKFANRIPRDGLLVAGIDNKNVRQVLKSSFSCPVLTFGRSPQADFCISRVSFGRERSWYWLKKKKIDLGRFTLKVPGVHNVSNALAASIVASHFGISWKKIKQGLEFFKGTKRRFEKIGRAGQIYLFDDYAHHPTEIKTTLKAARQWFDKKRIICIFQPHTFSRTKALFDEFARSFEWADTAIIVDIYSSAREKKDLEVSSRMLVQEAQKHHQEILYLAKKKQVLEWLKKNVGEKDLILTMGAGDIFLWHKEILKVVGSS